LAASVTDSHNNYDLSFKEALDLFKGKSLDFLGLKGHMPLDEALSTQLPRTESSFSDSDLAFAEGRDRGLHIEIGVVLCMPDLYRYCRYNIGLMEKHGRDFTTLVITRDCSAASINGDSLTFAPVIVRFSDYDADKMLAGLTDRIGKGLEVNELELVFVSLFGSKRSPDELLVEAVELIKRLPKPENEIAKLISLALLTANKVAKKETLDRIMEENLTIMQKYRFLEKMEEIGAAKTLAANIATMSGNGLSAEQIASVLSMDVSKVRDILARGPQAVTAPETEAASASVAQAS